MQCLIADRNIGGAAANIHGYQAIGEIGVTSIIRRGCCSLIIVSNGINRTGQIGSHHTVQNNLCKLPVLPQRTQCDIIRIGNKQLDEGVACRGRNQFLIQQIQHCVGINTSQERSGCMVVSNIQRMIELHVSHDLLCQQGVRIRNVICQTNQRITGCQEETTIDIILLIRRIGQH